MLIVLYSSPDSSKHLSKNFESSFMNITNKVSADNKQVIIIGYNK